MNPRIPNPNPLAAAAAALLLAAPLVAQETRAPRASTGAPVAARPAAKIPQVTPAPVPVPSGAAQAQPGALPEADIFSPEPEIDFGEILQGEKRAHTFLVANRGEKDIQIRAVNPTCGCTIAEVKAPDGTMIDPKKHTPNTDMLTLKPSDTCEVSVEFNSRGQPLHQLTKHIMVISSDDRMPALRLTMKMKVTSGIELEPNPLQFGEITRGSEVTKRAWAKLKTVKDIEITEIGEKPAYADVKWERGTAPDGTEAIAIDVTILGTAPIGYVAPALVLKTNHEKLNQIQVQLYAHVKSEVVFDTGNKINKERIDFEVIPFGEARKRTVEITNGNPAVPYAVTGVDVDSMHKDKLTAELETIEEGKHYKIHLTTADDLDARFFRGKLIVRSGSAEMPAKEIFFHGWIKKG
ncbi:MAG: DUF1573 domain-containing protein [Planctomycetota bacterium JB042]